MSASATKRTFAVDEFNVGYWAPSGRLLATDPERFSLRSLSVACNGSKSFPDSRLAFPVLGQQVP
jgi:hypothetical protein